MNWLTAFDTDWARLLAIAIVALAFVAKPMVNAFVEDRKDRRLRQMQDKHFQAKVREAIERRQAESLDLDG